jgi:hypothetical protein
VPPSRFNRTSWPDGGAHRDFLEFLDAVHRRCGCRSLREIGKTMHLSYTRVHDIVRGASLPVSEEQARSLVLALMGRSDEESEQVAKSAVGFFVKARRERDEQNGSPESDKSIVGGGDEGTVVVDSTSESAIVTPRPSFGRFAGFGRQFSRAAVGFGVGAVVVLIVVVVASVALLKRTNPAAPTTGAVILQDTFDGTALDPKKWERPTRADLIYPRDGVLNFVVGPSDTKGGVEARLAPRSVRGFHEIAFSIGMSELVKAGPGGGSMTIIETNGRTHRLIFGAGTEGPIVAALVCSRPECHQYDDYDPPGQYVPFVLGEQVPVRVVQTDDGRINFYARDELIAQGPRGASPLMSFTFDIYGIKEEAWHITVGSLIVS